MRAGPVAYDFPERGEPGVRSFKNTGLIESPHETARLKMRTPGCTFAYFAMVVLDAVSVEPVSSGLELPAPRPRNSALGNIRLRFDGPPLMRPWQTAVDEYVREFLETWNVGLEGGK
jgi:hypothetical protein